MPRLHRTSCPRISEERLLKEWFSPRERERYERLRSPRRRRSWLAGRLAAKALLQEHLGETEGRRVCPPEIEIVSAPGGEPSAIVQGEPWKISLSIAHCGDRGLAGIADPEEGCIGVDLERVRPVHPRLAERLLHPGDREVLAELDPKGGERSRLILAWVLKEAAFKAVHPSLPQGAPLSLRDLRLRGLCKNPDSQAQVLLGSSLGGREAELQAAAERTGDMWVVWALLPPSQRTPNEGPRSSRCGLGGGLPDHGP